MAAQPIGHDVGQRQEINSPVKAEHFGGGEHHAGELEKGALGGQDGFEARFPEERQQDDQSDRGAQQEDLADRIG